jgi:hypothetical protein
MSIYTHCKGEMRPFQTDPDPDLPFRMADDALRIDRKFPERQLAQSVIDLRETASE